MRRLPYLFVALSLTVPLVPVAPAASAPAAATGGLAVHQGSGVVATTVPLGPLLDRLGGTLVQPGSGFETVGLTWTGDRPPHVEVRTRDLAGAWGGWTALEPLTDFGELGSPAPRATEPLWVGPSDAVRVRVDHDGHDGDGDGDGGGLLDLILIDPGEDPDDEEAEPTLDPAYRKAAKPHFKRAPMPELYRRKEWGANEKWVKGPRVFNETIKQVHVHHTASSTSYARGDVPGILRSIYWYHTKKLGWSDIGYNFLVDKFGRIWEGRSGGARHRVRGAHTLGFNHVSVGIAAIGNFDQARATRPVMRGIARLAAWKLDKEGRRPAGRTRVRSDGSDRFARGKKVRLPVIDGHRDTNQTACPGGSLHRSLPWIRRRAQTRADNYGR